jgi:hypothetical protein
VRSVASSDSRSRSIPRRFLAGCHSPKPFMMSGRKLNLIKFKKCTIEFTTKYLSCFQCFALIDQPKLLSCSHRFCSKCRPPGTVCLICKAAECDFSQPMSELLQIFANLQTSLGIDQKIRQKCFDKINPNYLADNPIANGKGAVRQEQFVLCSLRKPI